jgi:hypothetical protein
LHCGEEAYKQITKNGALTAEIRDAVSIDKESYVVTPKSPIVKLDDSNNLAEEMRQFSAKANLPSVILAASRIGFDGDESIEKSKLEEVWLRLSGMDT